MLGAASILLALSYLAGVFELLSDPDEASRMLRDLGVWSALLYVAAFALLEPFFVPGILFVIPATAVWPYSVAFPLSWAGAVGAGVVGFTFARFLARDWVAHRLPERVRRYDDQLEEHGLRTVVIVRLTLFLFPPAHWALGLSRVRFPAFLAGTMIGFLPGMALLTWVGGGIVDWVMALPDGVRVLLLVGVAGIVAYRHWPSRRVPDDSD